MKKKLKRWKGGPLKKTAETDQVKDLRIVWIDDAPLRDQATAEYKKAMAKLDQICADQRRFEQKDQPEYDRWMAEKFGPLITDLKTNARLIEEQQELIEELEYEMIWGNQNTPQKVYAAVMKERETEANEKFEYDPFKGSNVPPNDPADKKSAPKNEFNPFENYNPDTDSEEEIKKHFEEVLKAFFQVRAKDLSKKIYAQTFAEFKTRYYPKHTAEFLKASQKHSGPKDELARIKEIYRILVRRLHPDMKTERDVKVSTLWHEVQEAYETRNLERLETLLALTEMQAGKNANIRLSQMQGALVEVNRTLQAVKQKLAEAKHDDAWGFSLGNNHEPMEKRLRSKMETRLASQKWRLARLRKTLEEWSQTPEKKKPKKKVPAKKPIKKPSSLPKPATAELPKTEPKKSRKSEPVQGEFFPF